MPSAAVATVLCRLYRAALRHRAPNPAHVREAMNGATARRSRHPDSCQPNRTAKLQGRYPSSHRPANPGRLVPLLLNG